MAKKKVYAVKKGRQTGLFDSWDACKAAVTGFAGAEFKGFMTRQEAEEYLEQGSEAQGQPEDDSINGLVAYVDGSFEQRIGKYSYGCILLTQEGEIYRESGSGNEPEAVAIRNVAGEMSGAMAAVRWAIQQGYPSLEIRYDYAGIEKWAVGEWQTKNALTRQYAEYMKKQKEQIEIRFRKVKAHSGNHYNDEADRLAKAALLEPENG